MTVHPRPLTVGPGRPTTIEAVAAAEGARKVLADRRHALAAFLSVVALGCARPHVRTVPSTPAVRNCYVDIAPRLCGIDLLHPVPGTERAAAVDCLRRIESRYENVPDEERAAWLVGHGCDPVVVEYAFGRGLGIVHRP